MRRFTIGIIIAFIALLAGCGNDTSTSEEVGTSKLKMISSDMDSENTTEESNADDIVKEETETAEQEVALEHAGDFIEDAVKTDDSGGAAYTIFATYRMAEDKISLEIIDYYSGYYSDSEWGWFYTTTGEMTEDGSEMIEFGDESTPLNMMDDYCAQVKELELTFFASM